MPRSPNDKGSVATSEWIVVSTGIVPTGAGKWTATRSPGSRGGTVVNLPSRKTGEGIVNSSSSVSAE